MDHWAPLGVQGQHRRNSRGLHRLCVPCFSVDKKIIRAMPWKPTLKFNMFAPWKMMVGRRSFPFWDGDIIFRGELLDFQGISQFHWEIMKHRDEGGKAGGLYQDVFVFVDQSCRELWCDMGQEKWMTSELSSNACSLHLKVCFSKELTNLLLVFSSNPFPSMAIQQGSLNGKPFTGGPKQCKCMVNLKDFPQKYHWSRLEPFGAVHTKRIRASSAPKRFFFFEFRGTNWWWPFWTKN